MIARRVARRLVRAEQVVELEQHPDVHEVERVRARAEPEHDLVGEQARRAAGADLQHDEAEEQQPRAERGQHRAHAERVVDRRLARVVVARRCRRARTAGRARTRPTRVAWQAARARAGAAAMSGSMIPSATPGMKPYMIAGGAVSQANWYLSTARSAMLTTKTKPIAASANAAREYWPVQPLADEVRPVGGERDDEVEADLRADRPGRADRDRGGAGGLALDEEELRDDLPPLALRVGRRGARLQAAVEAEAQQHEDREEVEDRHDAQDPVAHVGADLRPPPAGDVRARERARDEIARQHEERRQREVDVAEDRRRPVVAEQVVVRDRVGEQADVGREDEQRADAAHPVAGDQRADPEVRRGLRLDRRGHRRQGRVACVARVAGWRVPTRVT